MRYVDELRDPAAGRALVARIRARSTQPWPIMEVCGGQTHTLIRAGLDELLAGAVELIHGPGCPVCVTPLEKIDRAIAIAQRPGVILCTYGDMMRVPGSGDDLLRARAHGADVRVVYAPTDAVALAAAHPDRQVVFFAVGFETTAPAHAMAVKLAAQRRLDNFAILASHVLVPPAIVALMDDPDHRVRGFIAPGHVCTIMGLGAYRELAARYRVPFVVAGFEPLDLLGAIAELVDLLEDGRAEVRNAYRRSVREDGNEAARALLSEVFVTTDMRWRGIGRIPDSGLALAPAYARFDAERRFDVAAHEVEEPEVCIAGEVLRGRKKPSACPAFGTLCTPEHPLGAPMVSSEGACAAYRAYGRRRV